MPAPVANPEVQPVVNPVQQTVFVQTAGHLKTNSDYLKFMVIEPQNVSLPLIKIVKISPQVKVGIFWPLSTYKVIAL